MNIIDLISENIPIFSGTLSLLFSLSISLVERIYNYKKSKHLNSKKTNENDIIVLDSSGSNKNILGSVELKINNKSIDLNAINERELLDILKKINSEHINQ